MACSVDQHRVGVEADSVSPGKRGRERAIAFELVIRMEDAALQLVSGEAVCALSVARWATSCSAVRTSPSPVSGFG